MAYKCRLYPNKEQTAFFESTFSACRWVWNTSLEMKSAAYKVNKKNLSMYEISKMISVWKHGVAPWLNNPPYSALQYTVRDLDRAFQNFFRRVKRGEKPGYPKFKSRNESTQSFKVTANNRCIVDERHLKLPKIGVVKCRGLRPVEGRVLNVTVKRVPSGKYFATICCTDVPEPEMPMGENEILGIDVGVHDLMTRSDGVRGPNNKYLEKSARKLRREQRRLSHMKKGSANWKKQKLKVARIHERVTNQRRETMHEATIQAVRDSRAIAVEDLNVKGMTKNHRLARSVSDASMSEMHRQLEYKCGWYGRDFVKVDRWYPSSKTCGECGYVYDGLTLSMREWTCPNCGTRHDRDLNAARNIAKEGERMLLEASN